MGTWSDHTDIRPTMLALPGLEDAYLKDGRVLTEALAVTPGHTDDPRYQPLAVCYKQLNSSVGRFGRAALVGDTVALVSGSPSDDSQYTGFVASLAALGAQRDALATAIKADLDSAAFGSGLSANADSELEQCNALIEQAENLAAAQATTTTTSSTSTTSPSVTTTTQTPDTSTTTQPTSSSTTTRTPQCQTGADCPGSDTTCATRTCTAGVCGVSDAPLGTPCTEDDGAACDGSGNCTAVVAVVRVGDGTTALSSGVAAPVFIERHLLSGALVDSPIPLPVAASGPNQPLTLSGTASSEGALWRSIDGHYLSLAGYAAAPGTMGVANTASATTNRVVARIDAAGTVDTSTRLNTGFSGSNVRGAASVDGTALPGMPTATGPSPYAFVLFDRDPTVPAVDTLYVADDRSPPNGGVQKWTFDGSTWSLASTFNAGLSTGARGLTGFVTGSNVTLVATTGEATQNKLVVVVDDGSASPLATTIATAASATMFHGVALEPQ